MAQPKKELPPLALTMGEPAGIGAELALKAWLNRSRFNTPAFVLITSKSQIIKSCRHLGYENICEVVETPADAIAIFPRALPVYALKTECDAAPGVLDPSVAACVTGSIETAVNFAWSGDVCGIVTNPIHKKNLYDSGFRFPGHTEFLAHLTQIGAQPSLPVMMLQGGGLRTVPVTIHIPLAQVPAALTTELIVTTAEIVHRDLIRYFGIETPRLAVAGLNPHAGEDGALGMEDITMIEPAVELLNSRGLTVCGPLPADTMFHEKARTQYDVALCMYHDQALIPVKTLGFETGVNITLGLDIIRTSPDHGTACDIAGQGIADPVSLVEALRCAAQMAAFSSDHALKTGG